MDMRKLAGLHSARVSYCGWTKSISHHPRNPRMIYDAPVNTNLNVIVSTMVCFISWCEKRMTRNHPQYHSMVVVGTHATCLLIVVLWLKSNHLAATLLFLLLPFQRQPRQKCRGSKSQLGAQFLRPHVSFFFLWFPPCGAAFLKGAPTGMRVFLLLALGTTQSGCTLKQNETLAFLDFPRCSWFPLEKSVRKFRLGPANQMDSRSAEETGMGQLNHQELDHRFWSMFLLARASHLGYLFLTHRHLTDSVSLFHLTGQHPNNTAGPSLGPAGRLLTPGLQT